MAGRRLEVLGQGFASQQAAMFTRVDSSAYTRISPTAEAGKVWLEPSVDPASKNILINGEKSGTVRMNGEASVNFGSGWQASNFPLETLKAVIRIADQEIARIEAIPIRIWDATEKFKLIQRLHSDLQVHAGNEIDRTDPGGQFS